MIANKRIESARVACPTRKERRSLLAAHSRRSAVPEMPYAYGLFIVVTLVTLLGCSSQRGLGAAPCRVCIVNGELTRGLVQLDADLERTLLNQLPAKDRYGGYCWYQTPKGTLEAQPRFQTSDIGYEFERRDRGWYLLRELHHIDAGH